MIVNYIQRKKIYAERVENLLQKSVEINQFTNNGPVKKDLEKLLHKKLNLSNDKAVVCFSNGTTACHALMFFYQKRRKHKIKWAVPAFTFPTPVISGFSSKIIDIELKNYSIDLSSPSLDSANGIVATNLFGTCCNIDKLVDYCKSKNKILIFDNASSPMTTYKGINICQLGDSSFGSLHHTKFFGFGEGGFAVVPLENYDELNSIANFGFSSDRVHCKLSSNFKMSEISAAYCYAQIENYNVKKHIQIQNDLIKDLSSIDLKIFNTDNEDVDLVLGNIPILFDRPIDISTYRNLGVEANKYYKPLSPLKNSKNIFSKIINLPLNDSLTGYEMEMLCKVSHEVKKINGR